MQLFADLEPNYIVLNAPPPRPPKFKAGYPSACQKLGLQAASSTLQDLVPASTQLASGWDPLPSSLESWGF